MRVANDNQILFYFQKSCIISHKKIGILLNLKLNLILSNLYIIFCKRHHGEGCFFTTGHVTYDFKAFPQKLKRALELFIKRKWSQNNGEKSEIGRFPQKYSPI